MISHCFNWLFCFLSSDHICGGLYLYRYSAVLCGTFLLAYIMQTMTGISVVNCYRYILSFVIYIKDIMFFCDCVRIYM